jgi:hypothetical protein
VTLHLFKKAILFQVDQMFHLVSVTGFFDPVHCCLVVFSIETVKEQIIYIKFSSKVGKTALQIHTMLCVCMWW